MRLTFNDCRFFLGGPPWHRALLRVKATFSDHLAIEGAGDMEVTMTVTQQCALSVSAPVDARGNPAKIDGAIKWTSSDETRLTLAVAADGMSANVVAVGPMGDAQVRISADADLGEGVKEIAAVVDFHLLAGQAVGFSVSAGTPTEQPAPQ